MVVVVLMAFVGMAVTCNFNLSISFCDSVLHCSNDVVRIFKDVIELLIAVRSVVGNFK